MNDSDHADANEASGQIEPSSSASEGLKGRAMRLVDLTTTSISNIDTERPRAVLSAATEQVGKLATSVARAPLTKDVGTYAAVGAVIALPLPIVGSAVGAAIGAGLGLWRNMTRHETAAPAGAPATAVQDPITELERLHALKEKGIISEHDFLLQKEKILK